MSIFQRTFHRLQSHVPRHASQRIRGLEEFFEKSITTSIPIEEIPAGRAWGPFELRKKSFDDLHKLWYVLLKERNMLATQKTEAERLNLRFLHKDRMDRVYVTMARIKTILGERQIAYEEANREFNQAKKMKNVNKKPKPSLKNSEENRLREDLSELHSLSESVQLPEVPPIGAIHRQVEKKRHELDEKEKRG